MKIKIIIVLCFITGVTFAQSGTHLQVQGRKIIGTCGDTIILKGINYAPYNWGYTAGENYFDQIALTKANCVRLVWYKNSTSAIYNNLVYLDSALARCVRAKMIPILVLHDATCTGNMADVTALIPFYTSTAFKALELKYRKHLIINIANEAGQYAWASNPTTALNTYKTTYQSAITTLRSNGLQVPLMIDAPDCGTNSDAIVNAGAQIQTADVLANTMFSVHGYWYGFAGNNPATMQTKVQALYNSGLCIYFGEVANQQDDANPCQYNLAYTQLLGILKTFNIGWTAWGWYNDVCPLRQISNNGNANNLSAYGQVIVNDPSTGLMATAVQPLQLNATCGNTCAVTAAVSTQAVVCYGLATGSATITLSGSGAAASGFYSKDGSAVTAFSGNPFTVNGFTAGVHTIVLTNIGTSYCTASTGNFTITGPASAISTNFSATACNSYVWQGTTYTTSGAKVKVLTSSKGCDSTVTLNLIIKNATSSNSNISVCANALPFIWNGISCSTGGLYTAHLLNSVGCDSAATLNLTIKSLTSSTTEITVCPSELPFSWNGISCTASGNYTAHLINSVGCDSAATIQLTVNTFSAGEISGNSGACAFTGAGTPNAVYTITATTGAAFAWTVPSGATLVSGQGTNSIAVKYDATFLNGNISVTVSNSCGNATIKTFAITKAVPSIPVISGPANACIYIGTNTPVTYSINPVPNASSYRWTLPANITFISASPDSLSVTIAFNNNFGAGTSTQKTIKVKAISGCGNSADKSFMISTAQPAAPVYLSGPTNACTNMFPYTATYITKKVANAAGYIWTVPPIGAQIISHPAGTGANDTIITVQYNNLFPATPSATVDFVGVSATSPCGTSLPKKLNISRKAPASAGIITGPTDICSQMIGTTNITGTIVTYSIRKIADAVSYNWTIPATGATLLSHPAGPGMNDTIIQVLFNAALPVTGGQVSVRGVNNCTTGYARTITVKPVLPPTPGTISGTVDACSNIFTGTDATYTIRKVNLATAYNWSTLNSTAGGAGSITITGHPGGTGINDTIVTVRFGSGYLTGALKVQAVRNCGASLQKSLSILTKKAAAPASISGNTTPCIGATEIYSCPLVPNASGYNWTVPANAQILNGQGSNQITVLYPATDLLFKNGTIGVTALSPCGASTLKTLPITKCVAGKSKEINIQTTKTALTVYPNPANGKFTISLNDNSPSDSWNIEIVDEYGTVVFQKKITNRTGNIKIPVTENLPAGIYFINSTSEKEKTTCRLVYAGL